MRGAHRTSLMDCNDIRPEEHPCAPLFVGWLSRERLRSPATAGVAEDSARPAVPTHDWVGSLFEGSWVALKMCLVTIQIWVKNSRFLMTPLCLLLCNSVHQNGFTTNEASTSTKAGSGGPVTIPGPRGKLDLRSRRFSKSSLPTPGS